MIAAREENVIKSETALTVREGELVELEKEAVAKEKKAAKKVEEMTSAAHESRLEAQRVTNALAQVEKERAVLKVEQDRLKAREDAVKGMENLVARAGRCAELETTVKDLEDSASHTTHLHNIMRRKAWGVVRSLRKSIGEGLRVPLPPSAEPQCKASAAGAIDAIEALCGPLEGAHAAVSKTIEAEARDMGFNCALEALVSVKSRAVDLPVEDWVEAGPAPEHEEWAKTQCTKATKLIVSLFKRGNRSAAEDDEEEDED